MFVVYKSRNYMHVKRMKNSNKNSDKHYMQKNEERTTRKKSY